MTTEIWLKLDDLEARVRLLEAKMGGGEVPAQGVDAAGFAVDTPAVDPEILALLQNGNKIEAIKIYREQSGQSLAGAKDAIDKLAAQLGL